MVGRLVKLWMAYKREKRRLQVRLIVQAPDLACMISVVFIFEHANVARGLHTFHRHKLTKPYPISPVPASLPTPLCPQAERGLQGVAPSDVAGMAPPAELHG